MSLLRSLEIALYSTAVPTTLAHLLVVVILFLLLGTC